MPGRFVFKVHSIAGLFSGLFILLMSLSGAALIFHSDIDALQAPMVWPTKVPLKMLSVDSCYTIVQNKHPKAIVSSCTIANDNRQAFSFIVYDSSYQNGKSGLQLFIHPITGNILQSRGGSDNFMSWLSKFHNSFHLGKTGEWLLGFFALVFLLSIITGFILFRKRIGAVLLFRRSAYKKSNLHQIIGVWALVFNLMIAVTGFWMQRYVFKKEFYQSYDYTPVLKASPPLSFKFDSAYTAIKKQYPDFTAAVIYFAQSNSGKTAVYGSRASNAYIHSKKFADAIMLDSAGGIAKTRFINEISADDRYDIINSQLHMGKYGGWGIKIIYFVFGLTGALLSITGFLLWWRRRKLYRQQGALKYYKTKFTEPLFDPPLIKCKCYTPEARYDCTTTHLGIDERNGRFADITLDTCKHCSTKWLRYFAEFEAFSRSGRWYRGIVQERDLPQIKPDNAVEYLEQLDWFIYGGSHFSSTGMYGRGKVQADFP